MSSEHRADGPDVRDLLGPYLLGVCSPDEVRTVRAYLADSLEAQRELESLRPVLDALLLAPRHGEEPPTPSAAMKRSVMDRVQKEASLFAAAGGSETAPADEGAAPASDRKGGSEFSGRGADPAVADEPGARRRGFRFALVRRPAVSLAVAALLTVVVAGGAIFGVSSSSGPDTRTVVAGVEAGQAPKGRAQLVVDTSAGHARLKVSGLPAPGKGKRYQLWVKSPDGTVRPSAAGTFDVDDHGRNTVRIPDDLTAHDTVMLTAEPAGGSPAPTSPVVLHATV